MSYLTKLNLPDFSIKQNNNQADDVIRNRGIDLPKSELDLKEVLSQEDISALLDKTRQDGILEGRKEVVNEVKERYLQEGEQLGYTKGYDQAKRELEQELQLNQEKLDELSARIATNIDDLIADLVSNEDNYKKHLKQVIMKIANKVIAKETENNLEEVIDKAILDCMNIVPKSTDILIKVHHKLAENLEKRIDVLNARADFYGKVSIVPVQDVELSFCEIKWDHGQFIYNQEDLIRQIDDIIEKVI